jgi:chemotaxis protein methyltransferase WspC
MTLLDAGLSPSRFEIDAIDISERALEYGRHGIYRKNSFRGADQTFRDRHFDGDRLRDPVRERVHFHHSNLFALGTTLTDNRYDVIFCRNLLIYFDRPTQDRAVEVLGRLLARNGVLFVGPSETALLMSHSFESTQWPMAFAFRPPKPTSPAPQPGTMRNVTRVQAPHSSTRPIRKSPARPRTAPGAPSEMSPKPDAGLMPSPETLLAQAEHLANRGDLDLARECCESFLRSHEPSARAHYLMGLLEDAAGHPAEAINHYRRAIYLNPLHEEALIHLATLIEQQGDQTAAKRLRDRARRAAARGIAP